MFQWPATASSSKSHRVYDRRRRRLYPSLVAEFEAVKLVTTNLTPPNNNLRNPFTVLYSSTYSINVLALQQRTSRKVKFALLCSTPAYSPEVISSAPAHTPEEVKPYCSSSNPFKSQKQVKLQYIYQKPQFQHSYIMDQQLENQFKIKKIIGISTGMFG